MPNLFYLSLDGLLLQVLQCVDVYLAQMLTTGFNGTFNNVIM